MPAAPLAGKIVIDTNNYYPQRDGQIPELDTDSATSSELLQAHLPKSKVVKAFNHIYAAQLTTDGTPAGNAQPARAGRSPGTTRSEEGRHASSSTSSGSTRSMPDR